MVPAGIGDAPAPNAGRTVAVGGQRAGSAAAWIASATRSGCCWWIRWPLSAASSSADSGLIAASPSCRRDQSASTVAVGQSGPPSNGSP